MPLHFTNMSRVSAPFAALWCWLMAKPGRNGPTVGSQVSQPADIHICTHRPPPQAPGLGSACTVTRQPLRVLRVMDADLSPAQTGRLRISGCMADVCAELDRLAAHEAMLQ